MKELNVKISSSSLIRGMKNRAFLINRDSSLSCTHTLEIWRSKNVIIKITRFRLITGMNNTSFPMKLFLSHANERNVVYLGMIKFQAHSAKCIMNS